MKIQIIKYDHKYKDQMVEIAHQIHQASLYSEIEMEEDKLLAQLEYASNTHPSGYFRLAVLGDKLYGAFLGMISPGFFCDALIAKDMGWWVKPEHRGSPAAICLLRDFEKWAKEKGASKVMIGQTGVENIEKTTKLFTHCGYKVVGYNTAKDII